MGREVVGVYLCCGYNVLQVNVKDGWLWKHLTMTNMLSNDYTWNKSVSFVHFFVGLLPTSKALHDKLIVVWHIWRAKNSKIFQRQVCDV